MNDAKRLSYYPALENVILSHLDHSNNNVLSDDHSMTDDFDAYYIVIVYVLLCCGLILVIDVYADYDMLPLNLCYLQQIFVAVAPTLSFLSLSVVVFLPLLLLFAFVFFAKFVLLFVVLRDNLQYAVANILR